MNGKFNLFRLHNAIIKEQFKDSNRLYCEFHVQIALEESKNSLKRVFSVMYLIDCTKTKFVIEHSVALSVVLMLLSDTDEKVRTYALVLAEAITQQPPEKEILKIFQETAKPRSTRKAQSKEGHAPLKAKKAIEYLEELLQFRQEIIQDNSQLKTFLDRTAHPELLEVLLRDLLDLPSYAIKGKLIEVLALAESHSLIFSITLGDTMQRLFSLPAVLNRPTLGLHAESEQQEEAERAHLV